MAEKRLVDYVKGLLQRGYSASAIRDALLRYGYSAKEVDEAINSSLKPTIRHEIHFSLATIIVIVLIAASVIGTGLFFYFSQKPESKLLDLNLEPITTTVEAGQSISFLKELSNLGSSKRYDVVIKQEIIDTKTNKIVTQKIETRAIETFGSTQTNILVPEDTKAGEYILRAIVEYENKKAVATLPVKILASATKKESCFDGIKNQDEIGIDCGGICKKCEEQTLECNDNNACTNDIVENGACINKPAIPCCGNNICEEQEKNTCIADCPNEGPSQPTVTTDTLEQIKETARTNPEKALQECSKIEVPDLKDTCLGNIGEVQKNKEYCAKIANARIKDLCHSNVAKLNNDNSICAEISTDSRKDSCYMTFVLDNKDYSVCNKITNKHLRQSCESLRQLNELSQQENNQTSQ